MAAIFGGWLCLTSGASEHPRHHQPTGDSIPKGPDPVDAGMLPVRKNRRGLSRVFARVVHARQYGGGPGGGVRSLESRYSIQTLSYPVPGLGTHVAYLLRPSGGSEHPFRFCA